MHLDEVFIHMAALCFCESALMGVCSTAFWYVAIEKSYYQGKTNLHFCCQRPQETIYENKVVCLTSHKVVSTNHKKFVLCCLFSHEGCGVM